MKRCALVLYILWAVSLRSSSDGVGSLENSDSPVSGAADVEMVKLLETFQKRMTDIVIIADTSEDFNNLIGTKQFPFPWCDGTIVSAMVHDLIDSLLAGHIVICTNRYKTVSFSMV